MEKRNQSCMATLTWRIPAALGAVFLLCLCLTGCATTDNREPQAVAGIPSAGMEERWGVRIEGIRLSAAGNMLDFRYRVIDAEKASPLVDRRVKPYLLDQASGARLMVPSSPKVGPLRQTSADGKPLAGRTYFILFANPGKYIKAGSRVTVVIGDFRAQDLTVE